MALHAAAGGAEVELAAVFSAVPSPAALSCLSQLVAVRVQLAGLKGMPKSAEVMYKC
jgi:hypothetical protein